MPSSLTATPGWFFPLGVFMLGVFFATLLVRRFIENYVATFATRNQWKKVWLPALPVLIGAVAAGVMHKYPFLDTLPTWGTRAVYGMVGGGLSSFAYKIFQAVVQAKFGVKIGDSSSPTALEQSAIETQPPPAPLPKVRGTGYSNPDDVDDYRDGSSNTLPPEKKP